eukprot:gene2982-biopygen3967
MYSSVCVLQLAPLAAEAVTSLVRTASANGHPFGVGNGSGLDTCTKDLPFRSSEEDLRELRKGKSFVHVSNPEPFPTSNGGPFADAVRTKLVAYSSWPLWPPASLVRTASANGPPFGVGNGSGLDTCTKDLPFRSSEEDLRELREGKSFVHVSNPEPFLTSNGGPFADAVRTKLVAHPSWPL